MYIERQDFLPGIHVLRGLAAVSTIFFHLRFMMEGRDVYYFSFVEQFGAGVTLFFILSCFSLFHSTGRKLANPNWLAGYALRRFFRIYPLFVALLVVYVVMIYLVFGKLYNFSEIFINASLMYQFFPGQHASIVWAGWTIGVEVTFYCVFPILFAVSRSLFFWLVLLVITVLISMQVATVVTDLKLDSTYAYMSFPNQLFVFILGGVIYILANKHGNENNKIIALVVSMLLFLVWGMHVNGSISALTGSDILPIKALALGLFVYYFYDKHFLYNKFTSFLGESSYAIYLLHPPVVFLTKPLVDKIYALGMPVDVAFMCSVTLIFLIVCIAAYIVNKYFEMPIYYYGVRKAKAIEV